MKHQNETRTRGFTLDTPAAILWATALALSALIFVQAGRLTDPTAANAGNVATIADLTILTADGGDNEEVLLIADVRDGMLFVYGVQNRQMVELYQTQDLGDLFVGARRAAGGQ